MKPRFTSICILSGVLSLFVACSDDDNSFANGGENEYGTDYVVKYYDNLSVCIDERQDETAYVTEREKTFVCEDGKWHPTDEKVTKSSSSRDGSSDDGESSSSEGGSFGKESSSSKVNSSSSTVVKSLDSIFVATTSMLVDYCKFSSSNDTCKYDTFTDSRDSNIYKTVSIGWQVWMAENLRYKSPESICSGDSTVGCSTYGMHYPCREKDSVCPEGWKLPSQRDFAILGGAFLGNVDSAGYYLKTSNWSSWYGRDVVGFSWEPFGGSGKEGAFWTETNGKHEYVYAYERRLMEGWTASDTVFYPIRCIKE